MLGELEWSLPPNPPENTYVPSHLYYQHCNNSDVIQQYNNQQLRIDWGIRNNIHSINNNTHDMGRYDVGRSGEGRMERVTVHCGCEKSTAPGDVPSAN